MTLEVLTQRVIIGKLIGFCIGILGVVYLTYVTEATTIFALGILFWYTTFGAIIAAFSVFDYHTILKIRIAWWIRAITIGAWLNCVIVLLAYDTFARLALQLFGESGVLTSPFWFALEGAIIALCIEYVFIKHN